MNSTANMKRYLRSGWRQSGILFIVILLLLVVMWLRLSRFIHMADQPKTFLTRRRIINKGAFKVISQGGNQSDVEMTCPDEFNVDPKINVLFRNLKQMSFYTGDTSNYTERVVVLTPVSNSANRLQPYFNLLCSLTYPHHLISVALGEDSSTDMTFQLAQRFVRKLGGKYFNSAQIFHFPDGMANKPVFSRHDPDWQFTRRRHLALSRNQLLSRGLGDADWVLWVDSDVKWIPPDLLQHLISAGREVVAPSCLYRTASGDLPIYDRNTWQETPESLAFLEQQRPEMLMLEGYGIPMRTYLPHLADQGVLVPLDGVGGCVLLVRADAHRKGLNFPPFVLDHHIETEGLGKMAKRMNISVAGFPRVTVIHG